MVVANICEKVPGAASPRFKDGQLLYNTEVAISAAGEVLAVFHKNHPAEVLTFDKPPTEVVTFTAPTIPGVTFGLIVCFDLLWDSPQDQLLELGATHFPYSVAINTLKPNELSKLYFENWSRRKGAVLLASNLGDTGSGVFQEGRGATSATGEYVLATVDV